MNKIKPTVSPSIPVYMKGFLIFFLIVEFSLLTHVPIPYLSQIASSLFLLILCVFTGIYLLRAIRDWQMSPILILLLPLLLLPFISAYQAKAVFDQPFFYGFLAERTKYFILSSLLLIYLLDTQRLDIKIVEKMVISTALFYFIIALSLYLFIDPEIFPDSSFVNFSNVRGTRYKVNQALIIILLFYSLYKIAHGGSLKYIILVALILFYLLIFVQGRSTLATLFIALMQFFFLKLNRDQKRMFISKAVITVFAITVILSLIFYRDELKTLTMLFSSALNTFQGEAAQDGSAASRAIQAELAWAGIREHLWFGNGFLSSQWHGGFQGKYGRFFPSDIGWLGLVYLYGLIGFLILNIPFIAAYRYGRKISFKRKDIFYHSMECFMLYLFLHSIFAGFAIKKIGIIAFPFIIIYFYRHRAVSNDQESAPVTNKPFKP